MNLGAQDMQQLHVYKNWKLKSEDWKTEVMQLRIGHSLSQFCASDEDVRFYTRFPSEEVFQSFWESD